MFSDPWLQSLFESYIGDGVSIDIALSSVREEIRRQLDQQEKQNIVDVNNAITLLKAERNFGGSHGMRRGKRK